VAEEGIGVRYRVHEIGKRFRNAQIEAGDTPHQHEQEQPETERAVKVPVESLPAHASLHTEAALPSADARPPDDDACDEEDRGYQAQDAVPEPPLAIEQQIVVETREPENEILALRHRVAKIFAGVWIEEALLFHPVTLGPDFQRRVATGDPIAEARDL